MTSSQKQISDNLEQLTQFLLINELCGQNETNQITNNFSYQPLNKEKQKQKIPNYKTSSYLSPFFMTKSQNQLSSENHEQQLKQCMRNSNQSQTLQILLKHVLQLPKLRYQQSQKLFQLQSQNNTNFNQPSKISNKLDFQTPQQVKNVSKTALTLQETQISSNYPYAQSTKENLNSGDYKLSFPNGKKLLDLNESSHEEQMDIEINMSARSQKSFRDIQSKRQNIFSERQNIYMMKKRKESSNHLVFQTQSQKKAKQQKNFIQNYFQSAKNQILDNCNLNCCQGIFGNESISDKKKVTMKQMKKMQLK